MTNLPLSNLPLLIRSHKKLIVSSKEKDQTGKSSSLLCLRATLVFIDGSYLSVTEFKKNGAIDYYHYDWFGKDKKIIMKFHSEPHSDKCYQTETEPFHMHLPDSLDEGKRLPNRFYQELDQVLEFIYHCIMVSRVTGK